MVDQILPQHQSILAAALDVTGDFCCLTNPDSKLAVRDFLVDRRIVLRASPQGGYKAALNDDYIVYAHNDDKDRCAALGMLEFLRQNPNFNKSRLPIM
jgi:hypothetical protein